MNNSTLVMVAILAAVAMLSAGLVVVPTTMQEASAQDTSFSIKQRQSNACSGLAGCSNAGSITFSLPGNNDG
jgi:hypothetical protein